MTVYKKEFNKIGGYLVDINKVTLNNVTFKSLVYFSILNLCFHLSSIDINFILSTFLRDHDMKTDRGETWCLCEAIKS